MNTNYKLIILPEIFGVNEQILNLSSDFSSRFGIQTTTLDYLYPVENTSVTFDFNNFEGALKHVKRINPEKFVEYFKSELDRIEKNEGISNFIVLGFCMGGGMAYLTGIDERVKGIISFYGTWANGPFYLGKTNIENLVEARKEDSSLKVLSFFGGLDSSTPIDYQNTIKTALEKANINYKSVVYENAGHAFMNSHRPEKYNKEAREKAILEIAEFLKKV